MSSDIPTLVLTGEFDPVTPPLWGEVVIENLTNATHVEFPNLSHGVFFDRRCAREVVASFLESPTSDPDLGCVGPLQLYSFDFFTH